MAVLFELDNALITFVDMINRVFSLYLDKFMVVFIDDILIYTKIEMEHIEHVSTVLQALRKHKLYAKLSKYEF